MLLLPEWAVLLRFFPAQLSPGLMAADALYLLATDSFLLGLLQTMPGAPEDFIKKTFWMFMAFIVLILFKAPVILLALATATAGYILFRRNYYLFEPGR